jgi:hypothetical protein
LNADKTAKAKASNTSKRARKKEDPDCAEGMGKRLLFLRIIMVRVLRQANVRGYHRRTR